MADDTDDIATQIDGFQYDNKEQPDRMEAKIDAIGNAVGVPVPEVEAEPWQPMPVFSEFKALPSADPADVPESKGILSGIAETVMGLEHKAVDAVHSLASPSDDDDAYPDSGVPVVAAAAPHAGAAPVAGNLPVGPHTQAVKERRAQAAPALAVA